MITGSDIDIDIYQLVSDGAAGTCRAQAPLVPSKVPFTDTGSTPSAYDLSVVSGAARALLIYITRG